MISELSVSLGLILLPIALGLSARIPGISHAGVQLLAFTGIGTALGAMVYLGSTFNANPLRIQLGAAILLTGLGAILGQGKSIMSSTIFGTILIVLGLSLGALFAPMPIDSVSLLSLFSYAAFLVIRSQHPATLKTFSLVQLGVAMLLILSSLVMGNTYNRWAGLFLAVTLFPLIPFHAPFLSIVSAAQGMLSSFWVVVLIALGLAELNALQHSMPLTELSLIPIFALGSGLIASLKCQGEDRFPLFIAYAAVAQMALLWAIHQVFQDFSIWGIQFGLAMAFTMSGLLGVYAFLQQRYGSHQLGQFPGLASAMPRLGMFMILLITLAMLLPILPIVAGLRTMPTFEQLDMSLAAMLLTFSAVWLLSSWSFSRLLHQTAFGREHVNIPYTDLLTSEMGALAILVVGASYSGFILL